MPSCSISFLKSHHFQNILFVTPLPNAKFNLLTLLSSCQTPALDDAYCSSKPSTWALGEVTRRQICHSTFVSINCKWALQNAGRSYHTSLAESFLHSSQLLLHFQASTPSDITATSTNAILRGPCHLKEKRNPSHSNYLLSDSYKLSVSSLLPHPAPSSHPKTTTPLGLWIPSVLPSHNHIIRLSESITPFLSCLVHQLFLSTKSFPSHFNILKSYL